jgi:hypothetical protein
MAWTDPSFDPTQGTNVGSPNTQDEFYGYGEGLMNPDQIVLDMKERIHMISADATPFFSFCSQLKKSPCHNTNFSWIEDEIFGHRDFKARLKRYEVATGEYVITLAIPRGGDWQALEAAATADTYSAAKPTIHVELSRVDGRSGGSFKFAPLVSGLAEGRKNRQYAGTTPAWLNSELVIYDTRDGGTVGGDSGSVLAPEITDLAGEAFFDEALMGSGQAWEFDGNDEIEVFCHTVTPNEALKGYAQGSGLPNASRKRSRSFHNYVQIFKTPLIIANTLKHIRLYGGPQLARERIAKAIQHRVDIELAMLFQGGGIEGTHWGELPADGAENPLTRFKGLGVGAANAAFGGGRESVGWIVSKNADLDTGFTLDPTTATLQTINELADRVFDDVTDSPSDTKVVYASNKWFLALSQMAMNADGTTGSPFFGWRQQAGSRLGVRISELETPSGILRFVRMPHFRGRYEDYALVVDQKNIEVRPLQGRDTTMFADTGEKYIDGQLDFFLTEIGMECHHESTHAILKLA